jgi:hypothetical protein
LARWCWLAQARSPRVQEKNVAQGKTASTRADLRFGEGPNGEIYVLNKRDGVIRQIVR